MDDNGQRAAFLSALTTEHFVMQTWIGATLNETQSRASMFIGALSGALVALGFALQADGAFLPFVATILPAVFLMGVLTVLRLVDIAVENMQAHIGIARVRAVYRTLGPQAEAHFAREHGRWPEEALNPSLRLGPLIGYWTSAASMIAMVDALVGAAGVTLLVCHVMGMELPVSLAAGALFAVALLGLFYGYQRLRIAELSKLAEAATAMPPGSSAR